MTVENLDIKHREVSHVNEDYDSIDIVSNKYVDHSHHVENTGIF